MALCFLRVVHLGILIGACAGGGDSQFGSSVPQFEFGQDAEFSIDLPQTPDLMGYLPEFLNGKRIIFEVEDGFKIDNVEAQIATGGVAYRKSRDPGDRYERHGASWGTILQGTLAGGWLEVVLKAGDATRSTSRIWTGVEAVGRVHKKAIEKTRNIRRVRAMLLPNETSAVLHVIRDMAGDSAAAQTKDSVDGQPRYHLDLMVRMKAQHRVIDSIMPAINNRLVPYVQQRYNCTECVACDIIARRYLPEERKKHDSHFDEDAFVTAVVALHSDGYVGGLYIQSGWDVGSREYISLSEGDAAIHQFDLNHGVNVKSGSRYSLIIWIKDSAQACLDLSSPWYQGLAEAGDMDAQFNLGNQFFAGRLRQKNCTEAVKWLTRAATQGHALAMFNLGYYYVAGECVEANETHGVSFHQRAADLGFAPSMITLGRAYAHGKGGLAQDRNLAAEWLRSAHEQGETEASAMLEKMYLAGEGPDWLGKDWLDAQKSRSEEL